MPSNVFKARNVIEVLGIILIIVNTISGASLLNINDDSEQRYWKCNRQTYKCNPTLLALEPFKYEPSFNATYHKSQDVCRLICGYYGALWPHPTKTCIIDHQLTEVSPQSFEFAISNKDDKELENFLLTNINLFKLHSENACQTTACIYQEAKVTVIIHVEQTDLALNWETNESYEINMDTIDQQTTVLIKSVTAFGARHGLETLSQLLAVYTDRVTGTPRIGLVMVAKAKIVDKPRYPHRGLLLDTARNYLTLQTIKRQIQAMSMSKMNVLHWHATDSQSFPLVLPSVPQMAKYGAYSSDQVYTMDNVKEIIEYAKIRGVRVILELDMPSHAGNGWQWGPEENLGQLSLCVNQQPWRSYCIQPPCGQLNPINDNVYKVLTKIFSDLKQVLPKNELFHMGGDEVFFPCWNSTKEIVDYLRNKNYSLETDTYLQLWSDFQERVKDIYSLETDNPNVPSILWSSALTDSNSIEKYLDKNKYIIQTWVSAGSELPTELLNKGYRLIISTKDTWYLDHGFWGVTKYHNWRDAYNNRLPKHDHVLGGEACMWGELVDSASVTGRIWPRTAAAAERLWSDSSETSYSAETRFFRHRERLISRGIAAEAVTPGWCYQNEGECR